MDDSNKPTGPGDGAKVKVPEAYRAALENTSGFNGGMPITPPDDELSHGAVNFVLRKRGDSDPAPQVANLDDTGRSSGWAGEKVKPVKSPLAEDSATNPETPKTPRR